MPVIENDWITSPAFRDMVLKHQRDLETRIWTSPRITNPTFYFPVRIPPMATASFEPGFHSSRVKLAVQGCSYTVEPAEARELAKQLTAAAEEAEKPRTVNQRACALSKQMAEAKAKFSRGVFGPDAFEPGSGFCAEAIADVLKDALKAERADIARELDRRGYHDTARMVRARKTE
jgi:hypothetical protein